MAPCRCCGDRERHRRLGARRRRTRLARCIRSLGVAQRLEAGARNGLAATHHPLARAQQSAPVNEGRRPEATPVPAPPGRQGSGVVALLTDFGLKDPFVGILHGVLLSHFPSVRIVDLCHSVPPQNVAVAAFWLERCAPHLPSGSVCCCVVDPGVGGERAVLAGQGSWGTLVAPDNGCIPRSWLSKGHFRRLADPSSLSQGPLSQTFHGRDIFAPLAAALASGSRRFESLGPEHVPIDSALEEPVRDGPTLRGKVVAVDHFGNLLTNLAVRPDQLGEGASLSIGGHQLAFRRAYSEVQRGALLAIVNAHGVAEVAKRDSSAALALALGAGSPVSLQFE